MLIDSSFTLSENEELIVQDAESFAQKDKEKKEMVEAKNEADTLMYSAQRSLDEHKSKLPSEVVEQIEKAITNTRAAMDGA